MLPNELLAAVFEHAVIICESTINDFFSGSWLELWNMLSTITRVSRRWRDVGLGTPKLWRNVRLGGNYYNLGSTRLCHFRRCLERSRAVPLNVWAVEPDRVDQILRALAAQDGHCIETLQISYNGHKQPSNQVQLDDMVTALLTLPSRDLRALCLDKFRGIPFETFAAILESFSAMRTLVIRQLSFSFARPFPPGELLSLRDLRALEMLQDVRDIHTLLHSLSVPKLGRLVIAVEFSPRSDQTVLTLDVPLGAFSSLREIALGGCMWSAEIVNVLRHAPCVESLGLFMLTEQVTYNDLLDDLAEKPLILQLHSLAIHECPITMDAIFRLFHRRRSAPFVPMRSLGLTARQRSYFTRAHLDELHQTATLFVWNPPSVVHRL